MKTKNLAVLVTALITAILMATFVESYGAGTVSCDEPDTGEV